MAFPIIPRKRSGATGNPSSLTVGELAVNTATGELFLGGDSAVMLLNPPTSAGTTVTEHTSDGTTVAFTFTGYSSTDDGAYLVSVGGIDQPPSKYSVSSVAGGTLTFVEAPVSGELISIRAIVAGSGGGGGSGIGGRAWSATETYAEGDLVATAQRETWICIQNANTNHNPATSPLWWQPMPADAVSLQLVPVATTPPVTGQGLVYNGTAWAPGSGTANATQIQSTPVSATAPTTGQGLIYNGTSWAPATPQANATQIQSRDVASTAPTAGQVLAWSATNSRWQPTSLNGSVSFNTPGTHTWAVPAWVRWVYVSANSGNGSDGFATNGADGEIGVGTDTAGIAPTTGANGADGTSGAGTVGKSVTLAAASLALAGGAAGLEGLPGYGGGGSGGGSSEYYAVPAANGASSGRPNGGYGGEGAQNSLSTGAGGAAGGGDATPGASGIDGGAGGVGALAGGDGGSGGITGFTLGNGGGGGGGNLREGGGGGGGACLGAVQLAGNSGAPGKGGIADTSMCAGGAGETFDGPKDLSASAGTNISIVISEGEGNASITITY